MNEQNDTQSVEVMASGAIEAIERAQVDVQIATARKYPRTLSTVKQRMLSFATLDEQTAESCFYTLPARRGGDDKPIQGPSVRMAEIALASYQHVKAGARIIADDGKFLVAQAVVHDLENNVAVSIEVRRRVTNKRGERFSDDMIAVTGNAACAIALRNAVFRVVPRALITPVYEAAKKVAVGDVKSLVAKRSQVLLRLKQMGVKESSILASVGAEKVEDIDLEKLEILIGLGTSIRDGEVSLEEAFPGAPKAEGRPLFHEPAKIEAPKPTVTVTTSAPAAEPVQQVTASAPAMTEPKVEEPAGTPQERLAALVLGAGFTLQQFSEWAIAIGFHSAAIADWSEVSDQTANRILRSPKGLITQLKGGAK